MEQILSSAACFSAADILLPSFPELESWAVIACDQFTSQPEYWRQVEALTAGRYSASHLILPESELGQQNAARISCIHETMLRYLQSDVFRAYPDAYLYTERSLRNGGIRRGIIGKVDLEAYDYTGFVNSCIRATEKTVAERIPPRMAIRRGAALELPHVLLLCDDDRRMLVEPFQQKRNQLQKLYDFDLMLGGGHIEGWLISGSEKAKLDEKLVEYACCQREKYPGMNLQYVVGDGNHSLATAKACYEELKAQNADNIPADHPARYALCELNNIHDPSLVCQPIHRVVKQCDSRALLEDLQSAFPGNEGAVIPWYGCGMSGTVRIPADRSRLPLAVLQKFLDDWLMDHAGAIDYIHGAEALQNLCSGTDSVGFLLPAVDKDLLFPTVLSDGVLPRKTFSMGEAFDKRYYLEARRIE